MPTSEDLGIGGIGEGRSVQFTDLAEEDRFLMLAMKSKYFIDTIKLIAYRAEPAMVIIVRQSMSRQDDASSLHATEADILPDLAKEKLTVRLHQPTNRCSSESIQHLIGELNTTETVFPGTALRVVYELVS